LFNHNRTCGFVAVIILAMMVMAPKVRLHHSSAIAASQHLNCSIGRRYDGDGTDGAACFECALRRFAATDALSAIAMMVMARVGACK
jgi:hypothetical protein